MKKLSMKEIQNNTLIVLKKIKDICEKEKIKYFLAYGTLLGAVRHKGFIPWDDDIDIMMPRADFDRFIDYCIKNKESLLPFSVKHYKTSKEYIYPIARFCDTRYKIEYQDAKDYGLGLFVDIYPLDGINPNDKKLLRKLKFRKLIISLAGQPNYVKPQKFYKNLVKYPLYLITQMIDLNKYIAKTDKIAQKYIYEESDYADCIVWEPRERTIMNKEICVKLETVKFEDDNFNIPVMYDKLLKIYYGDYMKLPPIEKRIGRHFYTAYKK